MKTLPTNLVLSKNMLNSNQPWLMLVDVSLPASPYTLYLVNNTEDITFNGIVYTAFPFEFSPIKTQGKGEIPSISFRISNVTKVFQSYLESYDGLIEQTATLRVVNYGYLSENYAELTWIFDIIACVVDVNWISFTVGAPNPLRRRFPLYRYMADHCPWRIKGAECKYTGSDSTCKRTLTDCQGRTGGSNSINFGGHIGLGQGGIKLV